MGVYNIYTKNGNGTISFQTGDDEYFTTGEAQLNQNINTLGGLSSATVETNFNSIDNIADGENNLISILQASNFNKSMLQLDNNKLIKQQNQLLKNNEILTKSSILSDIRNSSELLKAQHAIITQMDYNLLISSQLLERINDLDDSIKAQTLAIKNQDLKATVSTGDILVNPQVNIDTTALTEANIKIASGVDNQILTNASLLQKETEKINAINAQTLAIQSQELNLNGDMTANLSLDITPLAEANIKIAQGVENQIITNSKIVENILKKNEHYDFLKDGVSTLKDTNGNIIKPREAQALVNAEKHIDIKEINSTTMDDIMDFNQDLQQFLTGYSPESLFADAVGSIDGFSENLNPFTYFDNVLKTEFELDLQKEKLNNGI